MAAAHPRHRDRTGVPGPRPVRCGRRGHRARTAGRHRSRRARPRRGAAAAGRLLRARRGATAEAAADRAPLRRRRRLVAHPAGGPPHRLRPGRLRSDDRPGAEDDLVPALVSIAPRPGGGGRARPRTAVLEPSARAHRAAVAAGRVRRGWTCRDLHRPVDRRGDHRVAAPGPRCLPDPGERRAAQRAVGRGGRVDGPGPRAGEPGEPRPGPAGRPGRPVPDCWLVHHPVPRGARPAIDQGLAGGAEVGQGAAARDPRPWAGLRRAAPPVRHPVARRGPPRGDQRQLPRPVRRLGQRAVPAPAAGRRRRAPRRGAAVPAGGHRGRGGRGTGAALGLQPRHPGRVHRAPTGRAHRGRVAGDRRALPGRGRGRPHPFGLPAGAPRPVHCG